MHPDKSISSLKISLDDILGTIGLLFVFGAVWSVWLVLP